MSQPEGIPFSQVAEDVVLIAVMGVTGSGKSTLVKQVTGSAEVVVGNDLTSCTKNPSLHQFAHNGTNIILIDTPGFDDTFLSDGDVLREVATCLQMTYECNMKLSGIIYMHRISDTRMTHGGMRNLNMFRKLCGPDPMENIILTTSFWGKVTKEEGLAKETELRTNPDFWAEMIEEGAKTARFENTRESGLSLIESLIPQGKIALQIQREMCDEGVPLAETKAGEHVNEEIAEMSRKHAEEMQKLQQELQEAIKAADQKMEKTLKRELTKSQRKIEQMHDQQVALKADRRNEIRVLEQEFDRRLRRVEAEKKEEEADAALKLKIAAARRQDQIDAAQKKDEKKAKIIKYTKIAGATTHVAISIASCVVNPFAVVSVISSFVHLANLLFSNPDSAGQGFGMGGASDPVGGSGDVGNSGGGMDFGDGMGLS